MMTRMLPAGHVPRSWLIAGLLCCAGFAPAVAFSVAPAGVSDAIAPFIASNELPSKATNPIPADGSTNVSIAPLLSWTNDGSATSYDVYCNGQLLSNQTATTYHWGPLLFDAAYFWRIDARNTNGVTIGDTWSFTTAPATNYAVFFNFGSVTNDGVNPYAGLTLVGSNLYGTTDHGGSFSNGMIFAIRANGAGYTVLHNFGSVAHDGANPYAGLTVVGSTLYGTTFGGGSFSNGMIFAINVDGTGYTNLHNFGSAASDGAWPYAGLTQIGSTLDGTTEGGGSFGGGTIFTIHTNGAGYAILHNFGSMANDGVWPCGALTAVGSNLYATTYGGGRFGKGTIIAIHANGAGYTNLYNFGSRTNDGAYSYAYLTSIGSSLYGTTYEGGSFNAGTIFAIHTNGVGYTNLYNFGSVTSDGANPRGGLTLVGSMLFGVAPYGGRFGCGTLYGFNADGVGYTNLHHFGSVAGDGLRPPAGLALVGSTLDGTTVYGGSVNDGALFTLPISGTMQQATITVSASPGDGGTVSGSGLYPVGTNAQLLATTFNGWQFTGWSDGTTNNPYDITVPATNVTYTADYLFECACLTNAGNTITLTGYTGPGGDVVIPGTINGRPFTSIGSNAFASSGLTSITIPAGVTNISGDAFENCTNLTAVYFQGNAPSVDPSALAGDFQATVYCFVGTRGWPVPPALFGGLPIVVLPSPVMCALTVSSAHGGTYPGTVSTNAFSVVTEWIDAALVANGATQYVCTGVAVKGNAFTQASPTNVTLTLTNNTTLTWNWQTQCLLTTATNGPGSVTPGGWYIAGSNAVLTATPAANMHFLGWSGDTNGCKITGNTLTAPMTQARAVTALFVCELLTVVSDHGGTLPGTTGTYSGTAVNAWVTNSPVSNGSTQFVCTGAAMKGNAFTQVSPTNVTLTLTNNATLTWLWSTNYWLHTATSGNGSVNLSDGWWARGSNAQIIATPGDHAIFGSWSGQTSGCTIKSNVITAPMTSPRAIAVNFARAIVVTAIANPPAGGTVTGGGAYLANTNTITLAATTSTGWRFAGWSDGTTAATHATLKNLASDTNYTANFIQLGTVTAKANPATGGTVTGSGTYDVGTSTTLVAKAATSWLFTQWENSDTNAHRQITVAAGSVTCTATFVQGRVLTVTASPANGGYVTGGGTYATNTTATLTATPSNNWRFVKWSDGDTNTMRTLVVSNAATYTGQFVVRTGVISLGTNALAFGMVPVGQSATQTVAITNLGPNAVKVTSIAVPAGYVATPTAFTLASNGMTNVTVVFQPTAIGAKTGIVSLVSNAEPGATNIAVTGTGIAATRIVRFSGDLNFGTILIRTTNNLPLTLANDGNSPMIVTALAFTGTGSTAFKLPGLKVPFTVAAGGSTNLIVTYAPTAVGTNRATLTATVTGMTTGSTNTLTATGSAVAAMPVAVKVTAFAASVGADSGALVVRVVGLTLPPHVPANWELASVIMAGGKAQVVPTALAADGTACTIALECYGTDANHDGIPDAMATVLGERLKEGVKLLTIQYADGAVNATTPFVDILVVEGLPMPLDALPATWQLVPAGK